MSMPGGGRGLEALQRAVGLHQAGRLDEAAALYRQVLDANPKQADALYFLGMLAAQRAHFAEAERLIAQALNLNPKNADAHSNYAGVLNALNRPQQALASLDRAIALNPRMPRRMPIAATRCRCSTGSKRRCKAYDRALALNPRDPHGTNISRRRTAVARPPGRRVGELRCGARDRTRLAAGDDVPGQRARDAAALRARRSQATIARSRSIPTTWSLSPIAAMRCRVSTAMPKRSKASTER